MSTVGAQSGSRLRWHLAANSGVVAWLVALVVVSVAHQFLPAARWLLVHLLLLGAVTNAILVWSAHFADALLKTPPATRRPKAVRLVTLNAGVVAVVAGVVTANWALTLAGAIVVGAAVAAHGVALALQARRALPSRFGASVHYYVAASACLPIGAALGTVLSRHPEEVLPGLRVALSPTLGYGTNDPEVEAAVRAAAQVLADAGAVVEEVDPGVEDCVDAFHTLWFTGAAKVVSAYGPEALDRIDPVLARCIRQYGLEASASDYLDAMAVRMALGVRMGAFHESWDVMLTPTMPIAAFPVGQDSPTGWPSDLWTSWTPYTYPFNMTQQPALSVPCGFTSDRRPIGLQLVGARHSDSLLLRVGEAYQQLTDWHTAVPTLISD